jgi:hypothetical protein
MPTYYTVQQDKALAPPSQADQKAPAYAWTSECAFVESHSGQRQLQWLHDYVTEVAYAALPPGGNCAYACAR